MDPGAQPRTLRVCLLDPGFFILTSSSPLPPRSFQSVRETLNVSSDVPRPTSPARPSLVLPWEGQVLQPETWRCKV